MKNIKLEQRNGLLMFAGFYLGYLRGRRFPPKMPSLPPPPPPKKKYCYHYSIQVTISEKSSRRDKVSAHTVTNLNIVSKCTKLHLSAYSFQKDFGLHAPGPLLEARRFQPLGTSPLNDKS